MILYFLYFCRNICIVMKDKIFIYIVMGSLLILGACRRPQPKLEEMIIPVKVQTASYTDNATAQHYIGTLKESKSVALSFAVPGTVSALSCVEGQYVRKGSLLATLDAADMQSTLMAAQASLHQAQDAYDRMKVLYEHGNITEVQWVDIQTKLSQAKSAEAIARRGTSNCRLISPIDGVIGKCNLEAGMNVVPGITQVNVLDVNKMLITVPVPDNVIASLSVGQEVLADFSALSPQDFPQLIALKIKSKGVVSNPLSHNYTIELQVANAQHHLLPGMVCDVYIPREDSSQAIVMPNQAVKLATDGSHFVWLAIGGKAAKRVVQIGNLAPKGIVITSGLSLGDQVIIEGEQKVSEGTKIKIR